MTPTSQKYAYAAAWLRTVMAAMAMMAAPVLGMDLGLVRWALGAYIAAALIEQVLIKKQIGGEMRAAVGGVLDVLILTAVTHRYGSTGSPMLALYMLIPLLNALVVSPRIAWGLALLGVAAYGGLLVAEYAHWVAAPTTMPFWSSGAMPSSVGEVLAPVCVMAPMILVATSVTVRLAKAVSDREDALVRANEQLASLNRHDALTGLYNRRHLLERLEAELARVRRGHPLALLMLDLDGFKAVNDGLGHLAGDEVLERVADALAGQVRETDTVGRYGGDEFVVLLADAEPRAVTATAERLRQAVADVGRIDDAHHVTVSIGAAIAADDDDTAALIRRADDRAYEAKAAGRDRVVGPS